MKSYTYQIFAMVSNGIVENRMICDNYPEADYLAKCSYGPEGFAVDCTHYYVSIGDKYHDEKFWYIDEETGEEKEIPQIPTEEAQIENLRSDCDETIIALAEMYNLTLLNNLQTNMPISDAQRNVIIRAIMIRSKRGENLQEIMDSYSYLSKEDKSLIIEDIQIEL